MSIEINIIGRFCNSGIDLEGTAASLLEFAERVKRLIGFEIFGLSTPLVPPSPYSGYLKSLQIEVGEGNVHILRDHDRVYIAGSAAKIEILCQNIAFLASQKSDPTSEHLHIEHYPGHFYLSEGSESIVLTRRD